MFGNLYESFIIFMTMIRNKFLVDIIVRILFILCENESTRQFGGKIHSFAKLTRKNLSTGKIRYLLHYQNFPIRFVIV